MGDKIAYFANVSARIYSYGQYKASILEDDEG